MSKYNRTTYWLLPMLNKHPKEFPGFIDSYQGKAIPQKPSIFGFGTLKKELTNQITIIVKAEEKDLEQLTKDPYYSEHYNDEYNEGIIFIVFNIPDEWLEQFNLMNDNNFNKNVDEILSEEYKDQLMFIYPEYEEQWLEILNPLDDENRLDKLLIKIKESGICSLTEREKTKLEELSCK